MAGDNKNNPIDLSQEDEQHTCYNQEAADTCEACKKIDKVFEEKYTAKLEQEEADAEDEEDEVTVPLWNCDGCGEQWESEDVCWCGNCYWWCTRCRGWVEYPNNCERSLGMAVWEHTLSHSMGY